jgi:hypothetical protein
MDLYGGQVENSMTGSNNRGVFSVQPVVAKYMQLTEAEPAFRALKSELSIRPLFHQKEPRVKAHVMSGIPWLRAPGDIETLAHASATIISKPSLRLSGVDNAHPLLADESPGRCSPLCTAPISCCPPPMAARSACAITPQEYS